jgi:hypothetical protein
MRKVLVSALVACALATVAQAADYVLPHEATPYQPVYTIRASMPGSVASLGYTVGEFMPVLDLAQTSGVPVEDEVREAAPIGLVGEPWPPGSELGASNFTMQPRELAPYTTSGLPFMSAYGDTTKPPFVAAVASGPLPRPRPAAADSTDTDKAALRDEPTTFGGGDLPATQMN